MQERTKFWQTDPFNIHLDALHATYVTHSFARHTHEGYAIGIIEKGAETFSYRGSNHIAPAGSVVIINPDEIHTGQAVTLEGWTYRMLYPEVALVQRAASEFAGQQWGIPFFQDAVIHDPPLFERFRQAHIALENSDHLERENRLLLVFAELVRKYADWRPSLAEFKPEHSAVTHARDYLHAHYSDNISLEALANLVHLSPYHLSHLFQAETGMPPHAYLNQLRVRHAQKLLRQGLSPAEVAAITGFFDQSHLNRHFKRVTGVTPGQYRKNVQDRPNVLI
jgi:AraC-like DNA-binding protein